MSASATPTPDEEFRFKIAALIKYGAVEVSSVVAGRIYGLTHVGGAVYGIAWFYSYLASVLLIDKHVRLDVESILAKRALAFLPATFVASAVMRIGFDVPVYTGMQVGCLMIPSALASLVVLCHFKCIRDVFGFGLEHQI